MRGVSPEGVRCRRRRAPRSVREYGTVLRGLPSGAPGGVPPRRQRGSLPAWRPVVTHASPRSCAPSWTIGAKTAKAASSRTRCSSSCSRSRGGRPVGRFLRRRTGEGTGHGWIRPPETVRRFTLHQLLQHWIAGALWIVLAGSTLAAGAGVGGSRPFHAAAGIAGLFLLGYHAIVLAAIGIGSTCPPKTWRSSRGGGSGPYSAGGMEAARTTGNILLRKRGLSGDPRLVVPRRRVRDPPAVAVLLRRSGASAYGWIRTVHAGFGAALTVHLLAVHLPQRWWNAPPTSDGRSSRDLPAP